MAALLVAGCRAGAKPDADFAAASSVKTYKLRGKVVSTSASTSEVTVNHEAIPGFMEAMTMPYKIKDKNILSELHPGDVITADLVVSEQPGNDVLLDHIVVVGQSRPDYRPSVSYHVPSSGDSVPDFKLRNQDGRIISLREFRGKDLLITFIYTRCPLPNFCPRVTRNFANIHRQLVTDPELSGKTHLLAVSFDPENDTPERLRAYGAQYIGSDARDAFTSWDFAVPHRQALEKMAQWFDVGMTHEADSTITHTLSTTLIGADGKVIRFYSGSDWTVDQVLADLRRTAPRA